MKTDQEINNIISHIENLILDYLENFDFNYKLYSLRNCYWIDYEMLEYNVANNYLIKFNKSMSNYFYDAIDNLIEKNCIKQTNTIQLKFGILDGKFIRLNYEVLILDYLMNKSDTLEGITNYLLIKNKGICSVGIERILEDLVNLNKVQLLEKTNNGLTNLYERIKDK